MEPVIDHDDAIVIVIVFVRVLVFFDDEGAEQPIRVLNSGVRMIPVSTRRISPKRCM